MTAFLENAGLLVMLVIAAAAVMKFRARRYLLVLIIGTAVGAWLFGYVFGARSAAASLYAFVPDHRMAQAKAIIEGDLPNPLWGLGFGALIIVMDFLVFGMDLRKNARGRRVDLALDSSEASHESGVDAPRQAPDGA